MKLKMKKIFLFLSILFMLCSCTIDEEQHFHYELLPVESVEIPNEFQLGETYSIKIRYNRPTSCHSFNGFYYDSYLNTRTIAVRTIVFEQDNCTELTNNLVEEIIHFYVTSSGPYTFKFWQGTNDAGEDVFLEYEIPVN